MRNLEIKNIKSHPSLSLAKANASRDIQINKKAEDALTITTESRHDHKCGSTTQSGRSMIEMLGVLAIIGVLSVGGIAGYSKAMQKYRINKTIEQITLIAGNVRAFFAPQRNYDGLDSFTADGRKIIQKAKLVPDEMWNEDKTALVNAFGNSFYIGMTSGGEKGFYIWNIIDSIECIELASFDWQNANAAAIQISYGIAYIKGFPLPTQMTDIVNACSDAYGYGKIDFIAYFDIDSPNAYTSENLPAFAIY